MFLESKASSEPEMTSSGKYKCRRDNQEYDTREEWYALQIRTQHVIVGINISKISLFY